MKIVIFSRNAMLYATQRLVQACRQRGHHAIALHPIKSNVHIRPLHYLWALCEEKV